MNCFKSAENKRRRKTDLHQIYSSASHNHRSDENPNIVTGSQLRFEIKHFCMLGTGSEATVYKKRKASIVWVDKNWERVNKARKKQ
jgi:hypothetical protein